MKSNDFNIVDYYMERHYLPEDYRETVEGILKQNDPEKIQEDLNHLDGFCYRMDPNNARYAGNPVRYPQDTSYAA